MKVVPSVLAGDFDDFVRRMRLAESFTDYVQIDIMDGVFVDTRSFEPGLIDTLGRPEDNYRRFMKRLDELRRPR